MVQPFPKGALSPPADWRAGIDLGGVPPSLHSAALAMVEASGLPDLPGDIRASAGLAAAVQQALAHGAPVLCDCEMVRAAIADRFGSPNPVLSFLQHPDVPALAQRIGNTRSAAAVDFWLPRLNGAVVVIGNAPTALFRLFEHLADGGPKPAAMLGIPVGFVGAAESKALLAEGKTGIPFLTVLGRRGGSAMAATALNALAGERNG